MTSNAIETFSDIGRALSPVRIREYQPYLRQPGMISFAGGWPPADLFPLQVVNDISSRVILEEGATALQYNPTPGHDRLRAAIAERMKSVFDIEASYEQVCITAGAQQGIFLSAMMFVDPGDTVAIEAPTFSGGIAVYKNFGANFLEIPMDEQGLQTDILAAELARGRRIKLIYTIPDFQNPSGYSMSIARREALLALAEQYDFYIVEDAPYTELRYEGEPLPPLYLLDTNGRVIYLGSYSKIFSPLRLGWMIAPPAIIEKAILGKQTIDLCCPALTQSIAYHFMQEGHLERHIETLRTAYGHKRQVMLGGLDRHMPAGVDWSNPAGGMFVWVTLPDGADTELLFREAIAENIGFIPGSAFYAEFRPRPSLRLNFVSATAEQIAVGMELLSGVVKRIS